MMPLLGAANGKMLEQLAWSRVLVAFDFDGTLAPIVADRERAFMRTSTADLFARVCSLYPCAIISGRSRDDVLSRLNGARVKYVVGNHGLEPGATIDTFEREIADAHRVLSVLLADWPGVEIEDKRYSLAIHYRKSRSKRLARVAIHGAVATLPIRMRIVPGKLVVNVLPELAPNKGDALLALRATEQADIAFYVGDDATDEDVFKLDQPGRLLSARVGESIASCASYYLRHQNEIDRLLAKLVTYRNEGAWI
jgi:trehalose 6-phosphate phosphatase